MMRMTMIAALTFAMLGGAALAQTTETETATEGTTTSEATSTETTASDAATEEAADEATTDAAPEAVANDDAVQEMTLGADDAKVTVVEYASFTCPHCATFHKTTFKQLKADYIDTGKIKFIYRDVYFDRPGLWAAMVARCEGSTRFFGISDMLYTQQRDWLESGDPVGISNALRKIGKVAGLSEDQVEACLSDQAKAETLYTWFQANMEEDDVSSTPTLIVNGTQHGNMGYSELKDIIDAELAE